MARANRYILPGQVYHVTHRCHNRAFLLKFARDRDAYRCMLRERLGRFPVSLLGYCLTSNHVHLLLQIQGGDPRILAQFMQTLEGDFAQAYNLRKGRSGAYWSDRYHAVMVERGEHLWRCLRYIDLNMVRAGVVREPAEWAWCGYGELVGLRRRYRVVDLSACAEALGSAKSVEAMIGRYRETVEAALSQRALAREAVWTESLAVGGEAFVRAMAKRIRNRMAVETEQSADDVWCVREPEMPYSRFSDPRNNAKGPKSWLPRT